MLQTALETRTKELVESAELLNQQVSEELAAKVALVLKLGWLGYKMYLFNSKVINLFL